MKKTTVEPAMPVLSRSQLDATAPRALSFLRTIGLNPAVRGELQKAGYQAADHTEGWTLLIEASGFGALDNGATINPATAANAEIEAWIVPGFQRSHAVLHRKHPAQEAYVFQDLKATRGAGALLEVTLYLDRLDALESSPARKSTRKDDHAALASLAERGVTPEVRKHLRSLLTIVQKQPLGEISAPVQSDKTKALMALHGWLTDWSDTARAVITNRAQLIQLGIAKRRSKNAAAPATKPATPITTPVVVTPVAATSATPNAPQLPPAVAAPALPAASATPAPPGVADANAASPATSSSNGAPTNGAAPITEVLSAHVNGAATNGSAHGPMFKAPTI